MKKIYFVLLLLTVLLVSCSKKSNSMKITDFTTQRYDTLFPNKDMPIHLMENYGVSIFNIEGESNDTIRIVFGGIEKKYVGKFKHQWKMEYYGYIPVGFQFDPYKASSGEIFVSYSIQ